MAFASVPLWYNGPTPGAMFNFPAKPTNQNHTSKSILPDFSQRYHDPVTTGTSVVAVKFDNGVVIAADTLGSYGTLARYRDCSRVHQVNDNIIIGAGGDYGDYQYLKDIIDQKIIDEKMLGDGLQIKPRSLHCWITRVLYNRRSKFDPLWNNYVVGGIQDGEPYLGTVDKLGTSYEDAVIATGFGGHLATPIIREYREHGPLDEEKAKALVKKCMEVLYYRDRQAFIRYQMGVVTARGCTVSDPIEVQPDWSVAHYIKMQ